MSKRWNKLWSLTTLGAGTKCFPSWWLVHGISTSPTRLRAIDELPSPYLKAWLKIWKFGSVCGLTSQALWSALSRVFAKSGSFRLYLVSQSLRSILSRVVVIAAAFVQLNHSLYFSIKLVVSVGMVQARSGGMRKGQQPRQRGRT
ncbi:hypothetical protein NL676_004996 [Syzygium grande]|nr:hypothetical protein NL676_004996 [Syzygium grande]